jgi:hypothetical protein
MPNFVKISNAIRGFFSLRITADLHKICAQPVYVETPDKEEVHQLQFDRI